MKRIIFSSLALFLCLACAANDKSNRPRILGIAGVKFYSTNLKATRNFYSQVLGSQGTFSDECLWCETAPVAGPKLGLDLPLIAKINSGQQVLLTEAQGAPPTSLLYEVVFATDNVPAMREFLSANHVKADFVKPTSRDYFSVVDPEGHRIGFISSAAQRSASDMQIIHSGFVVKDRAAEDKFYKDVLGFHVYWHGGMKEGEDNWVDMQVPDGTDWIEYMLRVSPDASHKTLGVMNHIALGVPDIHAAEQQLIKNGWKPTEEPKIGRDGKWQLNLYDPDETRVELMEFKPTKEPCCSPYSGPHPGPKQ